MKSYTNLEQSKKLAEILPLESADMLYYCNKSNNIQISQHPFIRSFKEKDTFSYLPCWSLAVLLKCLSEIKPRVYTPVLFPSEGKWILQFVEYSHGNVCEISYDNPIDACVVMIEKLHELKML